VKLTGALQYHLHGILSIAIWGSFETYVQGLLKEIYARHPDMTKSDRSITIRQVVEERSDIIGLLIDQEIAYIGTLGLPDLFKYLKRKILYDFPEDQKVVRSSPVAAG
jgi:hypothetical protein